MKPRILIVADDLTGAAEIGGIAFDCGLTARILFDTDYASNYPEDVIILDAHSRNLNPEDAYQRIKEMISGVDLSTFDLVFKKVDSLLRGPIASEIKALLDKMHEDSAYLIPANPSKNRIIRSGKYYIDGLAINKTSFRHDPQYPRTSKYVRDLIIDSSHALITANDPSHESRIRIMIPDMTTREELQAFVGNLPDEPMLLAGASDFFREILWIKFKLQKTAEVKRFRLTKSTHFLIGSNSQSSRKTVRLLAGLDYSIFRMPLAVIEDHNKFKEWNRHIFSELENHRRIVISGPARRVEGSQKIKLISERLVCIAKRIVEKLPSDSLFLIEGGETSSRFFRSMGWYDLKISDAYETGVVSLSPPDCEIHIIIKPGSYQWPDYVLNPLQELVSGKVT